MTFIQSAENLIKNNFKKELIYSEIIKKESKPTLRASILLPEDEDGAHTLPAVEFSPGRMVFEETHHNTLNFFLDNQGNLSINIHGVAPDFEILEDGDNFVYESMDLKIGHLYQLVEIVKYFLHVSEENILEASPLSLTPIENKDIFEEVMLYVPKMGSLLLPLEQINSSQTKRLYEIMSQMDHPMLDEIEGESMVDTQERYDKKSNELSEEFSYFQKIFKDKAIEYQEDEADLIYEMTKGISFYSYDWQDFKAHENLKESAQIFFVLRIKKETSFTAVSNFIEKTAQGEELLKNLFDKHELPGNLTLANSWRGQIEHALIVLAYKQKLKFDFLRMLEHKDDVQQEKLKLELRSEKLEKFYKDISSFNLPVD
jgi:hypothetical protein